MQRWASVYTIGAIVAGGVWGAAGILFELSNSVPHQAFMAFALGVMASLPRELQLLHARRLAGLLADLTQAAALPTKQAKGDYVFRTLTELADRYGADS